MCKLGNGYGVSIDAEPIYNELISRFSDRQLAIVVNLIGTDREFQSRLQFAKFQANVQRLAQAFLARTNNIHLKQAFSAVKNADVATLRTLWLGGEFKRSLAALKHQGV
jgi:hypothetical protein